MTTLALVIDMAGNALALAADMAGNTLALAIDIVGLVSRLFSLDFSDADNSQYLGLF